MPIAMFNALQFVPDGGAAGYRDYGAAVMPLLAEAGAQILVPFMPVEKHLAGELAADLVGVVQYPSRDAFGQMVRSEKYQQVAHLRTDATTVRVLTECAIDPPHTEPLDLPPGIVVLNSLWFAAGQQDRYQDYLSAAEPLAAAVGGRLLLPQLVPITAWEGDFIPDLLQLGWYPSEEAFFEMAGTPEFAAALAIRGDAVARSSTDLLRAG